MLLSSLLVVTGVILGGILARYRRVHPGGIVLIPILAVFSLRSVILFPLFVVGLALAYASIHIVRRYVLIYGLRRRGLAIAVGALPTVVAIGAGVDIEAVAVAASALPGVVAVSLHRQSRDLQENAVVTYGIAAGGLGIGGILAVGASFTPPCITCGVVPWSAFPPVLLDRGTDAAVFLGYGFRVARPEIGPLIAVIGLVAIAVVLTATLEVGWGLGFLGVVDLPILVILALRSQLTLIVYVVLVIVCYGAIAVVYRRTLVHGPPLVAVAVLVGAVGVLWPAAALAAADGIGVFVAGLLAAIGAYQLHKTSSIDRPASILSSLGIFVIAFATARVVMDPFPEGLAHTVGLPHIAVAALLVASTGWILYTHGHEIRPQRTDVGWINNG